MRRTVIRRLSTALVALALPLGVGSAALAQEKYPARPVRLLIPYPAGGAIDTIGRTLAEQLARQMGQPVVVENRPGAGGRLAADALARSAPDGYTVLITTAAPISVAPALTRKLAYSVENDLMPLTRVAEIVNVMLVNPGTGVGSVKDFVDWAKRRGGPVRYGSAGVGSADHLAGEFFQKLTGLPMLHVPYKGGGAAMTDLASGIIDVGFSTYVVAMPHLGANRVRIIGVTTPARQPLLPEVSPVGDSVRGFAVSNWAGVFLPKATPAPVAERLFSELNRAIAVPEVKARLGQAGVETVGSASSAEFAAFVREDTKHWEGIVRDANIPQE